MGLDCNGTRFLLYAKTRGVDYSQSAMIGRQGLQLEPSQLIENLNDLGFSFSNGTIDAIFDKDHGYAEELLKSLGANCVHSFDNSEYEGATHIHDMNREIPGDFIEKYSMVLDGGSLEHVFNFPVAIKNCMRMLQVGGHYLAITPANNFMGHGFYQFSPELYFSIFTRDNGFEIIDVIAFENEPKANWFEVKSPLSLRRRVTLTNSKPVYLLVIAKRVAICEIFDSSPQQSDYVSLWNEEKEPSTPIASRKKATRKTNVLMFFVKKYIPQSMKFLFEKLVRRRRLGFRRRYYRKMLPVDGAPDKELRHTLVNTRQ